MRVSNYPWWFFIGAYVSCDLFETEIEAIQNRNQFRNIIYT